MRKFRFKGLCILLNNEWRMLERCHRVNRWGLTLRAQAQLKEKQQELLHGTQPLQLHLGLSYWTLTTQENEEKWCWGISGFKEWEEQKPIKLVWWLARIFWLWPIFSSSIHLFLCSFIRKNIETCIVETVQRAGYKMGLPSQNKQSIWGNRC